MTFNNTVDTLIEAINNLSNEQLNDLAAKIRTTPEGIQAYTAFVYGSLADVENEVAPTEEEEVEDEA